MGAVDDELRFHGYLHRRELVAVDRRRDGDEGADARVGGAGRRGDIRAEGEAGGPHLQRRILSGQVIHRGAEVVHLASPLVPGAGAAAYAAEVEAEDNAADARQPLGSLEDALGVHRPAFNGKRVREHDGSARFSSWPVDEHLERSGRTRDFANGISQHVS